MFPRNHAPTPVSRKKVGAQRCVTQRVKKSATLAVAGSVGLAGTPT